MARLEMRPTYIVGHNFGDGRFINLAGANSPHILAQPDQLRRGETIRACASAVLDNQIPCRACTNTVDSGKGTTLFSRDADGRVTLLNGTGFLHINGA